MQEAQQEVVRRRISFEDQKLTVQVLNPESAQDWTTDPSMVEVYIGLETLARVVRAFKIVKQENLDEARIDIGVSYEVFDLAENQEINPEFAQYDAIKRLFDLEENQEINPEAPQVVSAGPDGKNYVVYEPEYRLSDAVLSVRQSGCVAVKIMFKDNRDYLYANLGPIDDLLELAKPVLVPDTYSFVDQVASLSIWSYDKDDGTPYQECKEPDDGFMDSHEVLMALIEEARKLRS